MQPDLQLPSERVPFHVSQIIAGALIGGVLIFAAIAFVIGRGKPPGDPMLAYIAVAAAVAEVVGCLVVPKLVTRESVSRNAVEPQRTPEMSLYAVYQVRLIIRFALLEGAAFFCGIAYISTARWWTLAAMLLLAGIMIAFFPGRAGYDDWVREQQDLDGLASQTSE